LPEAHQYQVENVKAQRTKDRHRIVPDALIKGDVKEMTCHNLHNKYPCCAAEQLLQAMPAGDKYNSYFLYIRQIAYAVL